MLLKRIVQKLNHISVLHSFYIIFSIILLIINSYSDINRAIISDFSSTSVMSILTMFYLIFSKEYCSTITQLMKLDEDKTSFVKFHTSKEKEYSAINILKKQSFKFASSLLIKTAFLIKVCINIFIIKNIKFTIAALIMCIVTYSMSIYESKLFIEYFGFKNCALNVLEGYKRDAEKNKI